MSKGYKGLRIGAYRITPLGLSTIAALLVIVIVIVAITVLKPTAGDDNSIISVAAPSASPVPTIETQAVISATAVVTAEPVITPTPAPVVRSATIRSLGEIAMQDNLLNAAKQADGSYDFTEMFSYISTVMGNADYTVGDVEGTLGNTVAISGSGSAMVTPSSLLTTLSDCGVDMLTLANDHALDAGFNELMGTITNVKAAGLDYIGANATQDEKNTPKIVDINGIKVGFVAYTESVNGNEDKTDKAAATYGVNLVAKCNAISDVKACRDAGADVVIAYVSWGKMLDRNATSNQKAIAKQLVTAGVDVIVGYNPHVIQPATWLEIKNSDGTTNKTLCLCATGNFLSDSRAQYSDSGIIFQFTIQEKEDLSGFEIVNPTYIPTYVWRTDNEDKTYDYHTVAAGEWLETQPDGMNYTNASRLKEVWAEAQSIMGTDVATVSAN